MNYCVMYISRALHGDCFMHISGVLRRLCITCFHEKDPPPLCPAGIQPMKMCDLKNQPIRMQHYGGFSAFPEVLDRSDFRLRLFKMAATGKAVTFCT